MKRSPYVTSYVYFIQAGNEPAVKIGVTIDSLAGRLKQLQTANHCRLRLLGAIDIKELRGLTTDNRIELWNLAQAIERDLHRTFAQYRMHGEWFHLSPEIDEFIRSHTNVAS